MKRGSTAVHVRSRGTPVARWLGLAVGVFWLVGCTEHDAATFTEAGTSSSTSLDDDLPDFPCNEDADCFDPTTPFCIDATCTPCTAIADPDAACAARDPAYPACASDGSCVLCTPAQPSACPDSTPVCTASFECRACLKHDECPQSACHLDGNNRGACFELEDVYHVVSSSEVESILRALPDGADAVFLLEGDVTGGAVQGSRQEVAFIGDVTVSGLSFQKSFREGDENIIYLEVREIGVLLPVGNDPSPSGPILWVTESLWRNATTWGWFSVAHFQRSTIGGLTAMSTSVFIDNSFIVDRISGTNLHILESTLLFDWSAISCDTHSSEVTIRNSIVLMQSEEPLEIECSSVNVSHSATEAGFPGEGNVAVGEATLSTLNGWFVGPWRDDLRLREGHPFGDIAIWREGDPLTDIDGKPRVGIDGEREPAGAALP